MDVGLAVHTAEANMLGFKISPGWQTLYKCGGNCFPEKFAPFDQVATGRS